ncbi:tetratricopeptide repeat protein [Candidatus Omnitrophota bacterium]
MSKNTTLAIYVCAVVLLTAAAFLPSVFNDFVDWDDTYYVTENEVIRELSPGNVKKMFTRGFEGIYCPAVIMSYALEYRFFRLDPFIYHLTNYILHILISISVFYLILQISKSANTALISAMLFALHPLHVESVAWVSERKDLLFSIFYLLSLSAYICYLSKRKVIYYLICLSLCALSLISKASAVTIPAVLLLLDHVFGRRIDRNAIFEKLPFFIASLFIGLLTMRFQAAMGATDVQMNPFERVYFLLKGIILYFAKTFWPVRLSAMYPYHNVSSGNTIELVIYGLILILLCSAAVILGRRSKAVMFGSLFFIITILPVLKIVPMGDVFAADRYMYLPSLGIFYLGAYYADAFFLRRISERKIIRYFAVFLIALIIMTLSVLTFKRCYVWKDTGTLFADVMKKYPASPRPYNKLGSFFLAKGDLERGVQYFKKSYVADPGFDPAKDNFTMAYYLLRKKKKEEGLIAARVEDGDAAGEAALMNSLGMEQGLEGNIGNAVSLFREAIELDPGNAEYFNNLGLAYYRKDDLARAKESFGKALELDPENEKTKADLGLVERRLEIAEGPQGPSAGGKDAGGAADAVTALNQKGEEAGRSGDLDAAVSIFEKALKLDPEDARTLNNIGYAYFKKADYRKAKRYFKKALEADPAYERARINLNYVENSLKSGRRRR